MVNTYEYHYTKDNKYGICSLSASNVKEADEKASELLKERYPYEIIKIVETNSKTLDQVVLFDKSIYSKKGYFDRYDYLESLADHYGLSENLISQVSDLLGVDEDFDGLIDLCDLICDEIDTNL